MGNYQDPAPGSANATVRELLYSLEFVQPEEWSNAASAYSDEEWNAAIDKVALLHGYGMQLSGWIEAVRDELGLPNEATLRNS